MSQEIWDAYDKDGNPLGFELVRGKPIKKAFFISWLKFTR